MRNASKVLTATGLVTAAALVLGGCVSRDQASDEPRSNDNSVSVPAPSTTEESTEEAAEETTEGAPEEGQETAVECTAQDIQVTGEPGQRPEVTLPATCSPPTELLTLDLVPGTGPTAGPGSNIQANYHLVTWSDGAVADSSWNANPPQPITLEDLGGQNQLIAGWNQGLLNVAQGARRLLVIPPDLGYPDGQGVIQPGETLVFVVDALAVTGP